MAENQAKFRPLTVIGGAVAIVGSLAGAVQAYYARLSYSLQATPPGASQNVTFAPEAKIGLTDDALRALRRDQARAVVSAPSETRAPVPIQTPGLGGRIEAREPQRDAANENTRKREPVQRVSTEPEPRVALPPPNAVPSRRLAPQPQEVTLDHD